MQPLQLRGKWVLVTGASAGLGTEIARHLAKDHGANLILAARRRERLEALAEELTAAHGVSVECVPTDLSRPDDVGRLYESAVQTRPVHAAVLNAGVTWFGHGIEQSWSDAEALLRTNVDAVVQLALRFTNHFREQGGGAVMMVTSLTAFAPFPYQALYGATKSLVTHYGVALSEELKGTGVSVTVFAPGGIATEMLDHMGGAFKKGDLGIMDADVCARHAVRGMVARRPLVVPGALNRMNALVMQLGPRAVVMRSVSNLYRKALAKKSTG
ncbi:MAG: SDR family NAD(P)-dependent oxidoreductase [Polyangiales bacterium]